MTFDQWWSEQVAKELMYPSHEEIARVVWEAAQKAKELIK